MELSRLELELKGHGQWITAAFLLATLFFCGCACAADADTVPPTIEVAPSVTNSSVITFYNGTLIVVSKAALYIRLTCNASYPVMWSLDSLEQPWTSSTASHRHVTNFNDPSSYKYSMSVTLRNNYDYISVVTSQVSLEPEEYVCHAAAADADANYAGQVSKLAVVWEGRNTTQLGKEPQIVYWGPKLSDETDEILIPCYTVNVDEIVVELFRTLNTTRTLLATKMPGRPFNSTSTGIRFEKYVGFLLKPSMVAEDEAMYECRLRKWNGETSDTSEATTAEVTTRATQAVTVRVTSTEAPPSNGSLTNATATASSDDEDEDELDDHHDYKYIFSEDELFHSENVTTSTEDPVGAGNEDDHTPYIARSMIRLIKRNSGADDWTEKEEPDTFSAYLNRKNPKLKLERTDSTTVSCCVDHDTYTSANMILYRKFCYQPLMCLTKNHLLEKTYHYSWMDTDSVLSSKCRFINTKDVYRISYDMRPALYVCHMRTDKRLTRAEYNTGVFHLSHHLNVSENSYFLETAKNGTTYTDQEHYDLNIGGGTYVNDFSNSTFSEGQIARFRCAEAAFFFATGKIWEFHWKNGTSKLILPQDRGKEELENVLELKITADLVKISCHFPPWNSTEWFTRSSNIKVEKTKQPSSASGRSYLSETVEFLVGETRTLSCALDGHPPPTYEWTISSSAYALLERQPKYYYLYEYHDTPYYAGQSPSYHTSPKIQNVTVSVSSYYSSTNTTSPVPVGDVKCTAKNVAGDGFIQFILKAKRPELPELGFEGRGLNRVFFVHDTDKLLNCTARKGMPQPVIYWQKYNMNITNSELYEIQESGNSSALMFKIGIDYEDEGDYTCIAANLAGNATLQFRVRIREPSPHSSHPWYEFGLIILALLIIVVIAAFAFVCIRKSRKISRLEMRAEYSKAFGDHEDEASRLTVATGF